MADATETAADSLKQRLSAQIEAARIKLDRLKGELASMHDEDMKGLQDRREQIRQRLDQQKAKARELQADIKKWKEEKAAHTQEAIHSWRQQREIDKLEARAEHAEAYAVDMVTAVAFDFDEAEQALLDAVAARYDAQQTAANAT